MIMMSALIVVSWIDFEHQIIPDSMWVAIFVGGLFIVGDALLNGTFTKEWIISKVIGLFAVSGLFFIIALVTGGRAMGGGDIKLMAAAGFALGWKNVLLALLVPGFTGTLYLIFSNTLKKENMKKEVPFGPHLAIGIFVALMFGNQMINWYMGLWN